MVGMWPTDFHSLLVSGGGHKELSWSNCIRGEDFVPPLLQQWARMTRKFFFFFPEVFFGSGWLVGCLWGRLKRHWHLFFFENFERKRKTWNPTKVVEVWVQRFFLGVLELRTLEIFCLYSTLLLGKTCFATNMPNNGEHPTTNFITLHVMIFLWTKGNLILRGVPGLHFRGIYKYTSIYTQSLRLGYKK